MLKTRAFELGGRDAPTKIILTERPALVADRIARNVIARWGGDRSGGIVALALRYQKELAALGEETLEALAPFVDARRTDGTPFDLRDLRDWKNVGRVQQCALLLHVDFLVGREMLDMPVAMRAASILSGEGETSVTFCSPFIAGVLQSGSASYVEMETVLSTEDVFNLAEILNVDAIRQWHAAQ